MDPETLLLILVILGIIALLGVSMLIPQNTQTSFFSRSPENGGKPFSWGFFIGMLFPIVVFLLLGGFGYSLCSKGYCNLRNFVPLLSGLGILWISLIAIKIITPLFIGKVSCEVGGDHRNPVNKRALRLKNLTKYITYTLMLSVVLCLLLFVDAERISGAVQKFFRDFGRSWDFLESNSFKNSIMWFFYLINISVLIGVISTLRMVANDAERRGNEQLQEQKIRDFVEKTTKPKLPPR